MQTNRKFLANGSAQTAGDHSGLGGVNGLCNGQAASAQGGSAHEGRENSLGTPTRGLLNHHSFPKKYKRQPRAVSLHLFSTTELILGHDSWQLAKDLILKSTLSQCFLMLPAY